MHNSADLHVQSIRSGVQALRARVHGPIWRRLLWSDSGAWTWRCITPGHHCLHSDLQSPKIIQCIQSLSLAEKRQPGPSRPDLQMHLRAAQQFATRPQMPTPSWASFIGVRPKLQVQLRDLAAERHVSPLQGRMRPAASESVVGASCPRGFNPHAPLACARVGC